MDNYEKQVYIGRELFLQHDQDKLIEKYGLKHDEEYLYLKYIGTEYRISRRDGAIAYSEGEEWMDCKEYTIVMTIYDFLCCSGQEILPPLTGQWQPVGRFVTAGSSPSTDSFVEKYAQAFSGKVEEVKQACICLGGKQMERLPLPDAPSAFLPDRYRPVSVWEESRWSVWQGQTLHLLSSQTDTGLFYLFHFS